MKKNLILMLSFVIVTTLFLSSCGSAPPTGKIILSQTQFKPGEQIKINFTAEGTFGESPWIGIIPSDVAHGNEEENDAHDLSYQYFAGLTKGEMTFVAPEKPGNYDFRMNSADGGGIEVTSVSFTVIAPPPPPEAKVELNINKEEFAPGEEIIVTFIAPADYDENAWIGIIPSDAPHGSEADNDGVDIAYQYLKKQTSGELKFSAPNEAGTYDVRMHDTDNDGNEVASKTFVVK